jgi:hypothetical protein
MLTFGNQGHCICDSLLLSGQQCKQDNFNQLIYLCKQIREIIAHKLTTFATNSVKDTKECHKLF